MKDFIFLFNKSTVELKKGLEILKAYLDVEVNLILVVKPSQVELANALSQEFPEIVTISVLPNFEDIDSRMKYLQSRFIIRKKLIVVNKPLRELAIRKFINQKNLVKNNKNIRKAGLVSIAIYNYNYGRYIEKCLDSIFKQTYTNFEVCISDNASDDESWSVISRFIKKYPNKIKAIRNSVNLGPGFNRENAEFLATGEYLLVLTSDDYLDPKFLEKTAKALNTNRDCVFAMVHRDIITSEGKVVREMPFYDQTCRIDGPLQAAVFMMAGVNPSISQIIYRREMIGYGSLVGGHVLNVRWFGERIKDFEMCCRHPIIYIKEPLLKNRVHQSSDGSSIDRNLIQAVGQYLLVHQFRDIAAVYEAEKAVNRLPDAIWKIAMLCLRYSVNFLAHGNHELSKRYLHLSMALKNREYEDKLFEYLYDYHINGNKKYYNKLVKISETTNRSISYSPPEGFAKIKL